MREMSAIRSGSVRYADADKLLVEMGLIATL
jgi:hypothetical protein